MALAWTLPDGLRGEKDPESGAFSSPDWTRTSNPSFVPRVRDAGVAPLIARVYGLNRGEPVSIGTRASSSRCVPNLYSPVEVDRIPDVMPI